MTAVRSSASDESAGKLPPGVIVGGPVVEAKLRESYAVFGILYAAMLVGLLVNNIRMPGWLDRSGLRGPLFVIGGLLAFALTVRNIGLLLAAPLLAVISGAASHETRFGELIIFAIGMTLLCVGVFKYALNLPSPILVIPGVIYI